MENDTTALEILRIARELVLNEHKDLQANMHNQWLVDNDNSIRKQRLQTPYPVIPAYPTEIDIVARAQTLLDFLNKNTQINFAAEPVAAASHTVIEVSRLAPVVEVTRVVAPVIESLATNNAAEPELALVEQSKSIAAVVPAAPDIAAPAIVPTGTTAPVSESTVVPVVDELSESDSITTREPAIEPADEVAVSEPITQSNKLLKSILKNFVK